MGIALVGVALDIGVALPIGVHNLEAAVDFLNDGGGERPIVRLRVKGRRLFARGRPMPQGASGVSYRSLIYRVRLLHDPEDVQLATLRDELQASGLGHRGSTNGAELVVEVKTSSHRQANPAADTGIGTDILFAADLPGGRGTNDAGPKLAAPQDLAGLPINSAEITAKAAVEHQSAISVQGAAPVRIGIRDLPQGLAGQDVILLDLAGGAGFLREHVHVREHVDRALVRVRALLGFQLHAPAVGGHVEDVAFLRLDRTRLVVLAAHG